MTTSNTLSATVKKSVSVILFLGLFYVLPLAAKPELIVHPQVVFLASICAILFSTQPRLSIKESKEKSGTDKHTIWLIIVVSGLGQVLSLIEWAYFSNKVSTNSPVQGSGIFGENWQYNFNIIDPLKALFTYCGIFLLVIGTLFRLYAIKTLGNYFSATVQIKEEHKIIKAGPYHFLRHPSYTGAYLAMLGCALLLHSYAGFIILGPGMMLVYNARINVEEKTLISQFGNEYAVYCTNTWKMFPFIW